MLKVIFNSFLNICTGVLAALALPVVYYLLILHHWPIRVLTTSGILVLSISSFAGGIITSALSRNNKILLAGVTGIVIIFIYYKLFSLDFFSKHRNGLIMVAIILPSTIAGGFVDLWISKKSAQRDRSANPA